MIEAQRIAKGYFSYLVSLTEIRLMRNLLLATTAICLATGGVAAAREQEKLLPTAKEIESVSIEYDHPKLRAVKFQATPDDWTAIRASLTPAKRDPDPAKWEGLGTVHLTKKNGDPLNVYLYKPSKAPGAYSAGKGPQKRVYYRGGNTRKLFDALTKAYEKSQDAE